MRELNVAVAGAAGRMGRTITRVLLETEGCAVAGGLESRGSSLAGQDVGTLAGIGEIGVPVTDNALELFTRIDAVIDFTTPEATVALCELSAQARIVHVIGTTGLNAEDNARIKAAARHARIVKSGNMSLGVNLLAALVRRAARALGEEFDVEILEMHHRHKVDAPSGTALMLGESAAEGRGIALAERSLKRRDGNTGPRPRGDVGFASLRGGSVVGEHEVIFAGPDERLSLSHIAQSRDIFARGAVKAALWAFDRKPGLYDMADVLGIKDE